MLRIFKTFDHKTSILDDFTFYDKREEIMEEKRKTELSPTPDIIRDSVPMTTTPIVTQTNNTNSNNLNDDNFILSPSLPAGLRNSKQRPKLHTNNVFK